MKKQKLFAMLLCFTLTSAFVMPVHAEDVVENKGELGQTVYYDMEQGGTQVFEIEDENGEISTITVTEIAPCARATDGAYKIEHTKSGAWTAGYVIKVSNDTITSAYGKYYETQVGSISDDSLSLDSGKQATYSFIYLHKGIQHDTGVRSKIQSGKIQVSAL